MSAGCASATDDRDRLIMRLFGAAEFPARYLDCRPTVDDKRVGIGSSSSPVRRRRSSPGRRSNVRARLTVTRNLIRRNGNALSRFSCAVHVFLSRSADPRRIGADWPVPRLGRARANSPTLKRSLATHAPEKVTGRARSLV